MSRVGDLASANFDGWGVLDSIERRVQAFVAWHGGIPAEAMRLDEASARAHVAPWVRRTVGGDVVASYVIGYSLGERWWTLFFERESDPAADGAESWWIEAYDCSGQGWSGNYYFWSADSRWRHVMHAVHGDDYGRCSFT